MQNVKVLKQGTKIYNKIENMLIYGWHANKTLYDCYKKPSQTKIDIWNYWIGYCEKWQCSKPFVISYNCNMFNIGFYDIHNNEAHYITKTKHYIIG